MYKAGNVQSQLSCYNYEYKVLQIDLFELIRNVLNV